MTSRDASPSAKRHKSSHSHEFTSNDITMSDISMSGVAFTTPGLSSAVNSNSNSNLAHGPLDHDLHGPASYSKPTLYQQDSSMPPPGLNSSLNGAGAPQTSGSGSSTPALQVKRLTASAKTPTKGSKFAAGYDMYAAETKVVPARGKAMIGTGIAVAVPIGTYGRVAPRSGLASKHSIATGAGVIDYDYRGEVKVLLFNHSEVDFTVQEGDRMAQLVLERIVTPEVVEVEVLEDSERGAGGFGSTGGFGGGLVVGGNV